MKGDLINHMDMLIFNSKGPRMKTVLGSEKVFEENGTSSTALPGIGEPLLRRGKQFNVLLFVFFSPEAHVPKGNGVLNWNVD